MARLRLHFLYISHFARYISRYKVADGCVIVTPSRLEVMCYQAGCSARLTSGYSSECCLSMASRQSAHSPLKLWHQRLSLTCLFPSFETILWKPFRWLCAKKMPVDPQLKYSDQLVWHQQPCSPSTVWYIKKKEGGAWGNSASSVWVPKCANVKIHKMLKNKKKLSENAETYNCTSNIQARTIWAAGSSTFFSLKNQPQKEFKTLRLIDTVIQLSDMWCWLLIAPQLDLNPVSLVPHRYPRHPGDSHGRRWPRVREQRQTGLQHTGGPTVLLHRPKLW